MLMFVMTDFYDVEMEELKRRGEQFTNACVEMQTLVGLEEGAAAEEAEVEVE